MKIENIKEMFELVSNQYTAHYHKAIGFKSLMDEMENTEESTDVSQKVKDKYTHSYYMALACKELAENLQEQYAQAQKTESETKVEIEDN